MKIYEILSVNKEFLCRLAQVGIKPDDYQYVSLFQTYSQMLTDGHKVTYIVASLADQYKISERKVYGVIQRLKQEIPAM